METAVSYAARSTTGDNSMTWVTDWPSQAACRGAAPDELFVQGAAQNRAKAVCFGCSVRTECLADALDNRIEFGIWGGMTERERRALLRRRPDVRSWRALLEAARDEYEFDGSGAEPVTATADRSSRGDRRGRERRRAVPAHV